MRITQIIEITEALDKPYPFNLKGPSNSQEFAATANTPNGTLRMDFGPTDLNGRSLYDNFDIDFSVGKNMGKTEAGDEFRVFATVVAMMTEWINTVGIEHVESFDFGANKDEHASDGRAKLYARFAKKLADRLGWKSEQTTTQDGSTAFFRLTNPNPVPREPEYWDALEENFADGKKKGKKTRIKQGRINEGFKLQLERDVDMMVLHITDTKTGRRTEVRGKAGYETRGYDANDKLHQLLDKIGKSVDISQLINGEPVGINPKHPAGASAKAATTKAFSEEAGVGKITKQNTTPDVKPGETERQAKKFFPMNKNGKPKPMGVKGATPNQAFNLGMTENISVTGTERGKQARKKKLRPGSEAWFKHWFSLPLMKRESFEQARKFCMKTQLSHHFA